MCSTSEPFNTKKVRPSDVTSQLKRPIIIMIEHSVDHRITFVSYNSNLNIPEQSDRRLAVSHILNKKEPAEGSPQQHANTE